jgi:hypothetical protein
VPTNEPRVLTGSHFMNGDTACAEGALAAGCLYFGGYPITPSTEIAERLAHRLPAVGETHVDAASFQCCGGGHQVSSGTPARGPWSRSCGRT